MPLTPMHTTTKLGFGGRERLFADRGCDTGFSARFFPRAAVMAIAALLWMAFAAPPLYSAREENASLIFQKTAGGGQTRVHVVKKGESIRAILRRQPGQEPVSRALIRRLNPDIQDLNRIYPGQKIVLPIPGLWPPPEATPVKHRESAPPVLYRVREGDSISRIILSELNVAPAEALPAYRLIRRLNPELPDLTLVQAGQTLRLPPGPTLSALPSMAPPKGASPPAEQTASAPPAPPATSPVETDVRTPTTVNDLHGIIRPVITRMGGTVTASGNYFIPLQETTQITIDCSMIPIVELDDGTTILLDYGDRLAQNLKELIRQSWKNYAFVPATELLDGLVGLQGIFRRSRNYSMIKSEKPVSLSEKPDILAFADWLILGRAKADGTAYRQALFLLERSESPLTAEARASLEKSGLVLTEIRENSVISATGAPQAPLRTAADLRDLKGLALVQQLLAVIGERAARNEEVVIFDQTRNGFNLSITADLLIRKGGKRLILHSKKLPEQFIQVLREAGTEVIPISERDQGRTLIEKVLGGLGIPVSFGYFTFRFPEEGTRQRFTASFSAMRAIHEGNPVYLVDFDIPSSILPFLSGRRGSVVRY